ncbi:DNA-methyltransferase [Achromobacter xylosoxidans]|uniref:DNA-methyltransferase n=1 Tax=Alcaligenes xylosoxydans xylosoxydans TaxID=85698 RepID=UPI001EEA3454|nr:site-specific DNA-methyltransferase [Achromobacter xylosoxidans]
MRYALHHGDCIETMRGMADASVDAIVTDPPYELGFMGKAWDSTGIACSVEVWLEALRVLKPGGHLLAFGGSRTYHRLAAAIEDAGFEIRDQIMWIYGSGFPKSKNLDGAWSGWGTALKPAHEPICVARKPLAGTVAANVLAHGVGALNIDGCRVGDAGGRWAANVIHDGSEEVLQAFPEAKGQQGDLKETGRPRLSLGRFGDMPPPRAHQARIETETSAARFFYCAKASKADRGGGNTHPTVKPTDLMRYLCRLITPPGGLVLDPFMGSGSTGKAAILEGFRFVGCELQAEYIEIARARIQQAAAVERHQYELEIA